MEKKMNEKYLPHIIAVGAFVAFIVLGLACASAPDGSYGGSSGGSSGYTQSSDQPTRKTTTNQNIFSLNYAEHNDGCLVLFEKGHFHYRRFPYIEHRNDNAFVRGEINRFNNEIKRLNAVSSDNQQAALNSTPIGSWYFVYRVSQEYYRFNYGIPPDSVNDGIPVSETAVIYHYNMWKVNVVAAR